MAEKVVNISSGPSGPRARTARASSYTNDSGEATLCVLVFIQNWRVKEKAGENISSQFSFWTPLLFVMPFANKNPQFMMDLTAPCAAQGTLPSHSTLE